MTPATGDVVDMKQKTAISAEKFEGITENQSMQQLYRDCCRKCVKQEHSKLDEKTVDQIVEEMERMPQLIRDAYRKRFQQGRPQPLDEATMEDHLNLNPMPPAGGRGKGARREDAPSQGGADAASCHING